MEKQNRIDMMMNHDKTLVHLSHSESGLPNLDVQLDAQPFARGEVGDSNEPHGAFPGLTRSVDAQFTW